MTRRTPKRFMKAAANGPNNPNSKMRSASAEEICASSQPNSCSSGTISTPGVPIAAAVTSSVRKVTADHDPAVMDVAALQRRGERNRTWPCSVRRLRSQLLDDGHHH